MKLLIPVTIMLSLIGGCTFGLNEKQAIAVKTFTAKRKEARVRLKTLQEKIIKLTDELSKTESNTEKWKLLLHERDKVTATVKDTVSEITALTAQIKELKSQGVPGWSIALNILKNLVLTLFGAGGLATGVIASIRSATMQRVANAVIVGIERNGNASVKSVVQDVATLNGVEKPLHKMVKQAGG